MEAVALLLGCGARPPPAPLLLPPPPFLLLPEFPAGLGGVGWPPPVPLEDAPEEVERHPLGLVQPEPAEAMRAVLAMAFSLLDSRVSLRTSMSWARENDGRTVELVMSSTVLAKRGWSPRSMARTSWRPSMGWPTARSSAAFNLMR